MRNTRLSTTMQNMNIFASPMVQHHILESWMNGFISTDHPIWDKHHLEPRTGLPKNELHNNCSMTHIFGKTSSTIHLTISCTYWGQTWGANEPDKFLWKKWEKPRWIAIHCACDPGPGHQGLLVAAGSMSNWWNEKPVFCSSSTLHQVRLKMNCMLQLMAILIRIMMIKQWVN